MILRAFKSLFATLIMSCYFFSFAFTFLPPSVNTKVILAAIGSIVFFMQLFRNQTIAVGRQLMATFGLAIVFSLICYVATDVNNTQDFVYATYITSFSIWLLAGYTVIFLIRKIHGYVDLQLLTLYLAAVCLLQCILALWINSSLALQSMIDMYIEQGQEFVKEVGRLYGIGASLDSAGVRFSIVLIMLSSLISRNISVEKGIFLTTLLLIAFFSIFILGNIISRTSSIGGLIALTYLFFSTGLFNRNIRIEFVQFFLVLSGLLITAILVSIFFYNSNPVFKGYMHFAFEGFFNFYETGEWRTDSTDKLNNSMWVWPTDHKTWLIGTGLFEGWVFNTDIGYCRFILYCGIIGFTAFAVFFIYQAIAFMLRYSMSKSLFIMLLLLSFAIWLKVSTDIFLIYALFYCIEGLQGSLFTKNLKNEYENRVYYNGNL